MKFACTVEPILSKHLYTSEEMVRWYETALELEHRPEWYEKFLMGRIIFSSGLRISEVLRMSVPENCFPNYIISVIKSKRGKSRDVRISPELEPTFRVMLRKPGRVFSVTTTRQLERWWDECLAVAKIEKRGRGPHDARHTYATSELASGRIDLAQLSRNLGHASVTMTANFYIHAEASMMFAKDKIPPWWALANSQRGLRVVYRDCA